MDLRPKSYEKICQLLHKGVDIPNPMTIDIGDEINIDRISGKDVRIYPGCRIYGRDTVISSGSRLGYEAPVTIESCRIGAGVELRGGYFSHSVFLEQSRMGMGAHVREGSILEEQVYAAHDVGLKQTILFPFVTIGSLINFCDCLMAGGTSRQNHSEVGSSFIHFNYTPDGDKATPSLIGDVPRGVMLNKSPIFLGGQGGIVGPLRLGYGNVVAAGSILRDDHPEDNNLIFPAAPSGGVREFMLAAYPNIRRIVENNICYIANLKALETWYTEVRKSFFEPLEFGPFIYAGVMEQLFLAIKERLKRLRDMAERPIAPAPHGPASESARDRRILNERFGEIENLFTGTVRDDLMERSHDAFIRAFQKITEHDRSYIETIQNLPADVASKGSRWLDSMVGTLCEHASRAMPSLSLFRKWQ